jgi:hypothetical protein
MPIKKSRKLLPKLGNDLHLSNFGYSLAGSKRDRQQSLKKASKKAGTLKVLGKLGSFTLKTQTAIHTIKNANNVPKLVISANLFIGVKAETTAITTPKNIKFLRGVPDKGLISAKTLGYISLNRKYEVDSSAFIHIGQAYFLIF